MKHAVMHMQKRTYSEATAAKQALAVKVGLLRGILNLLSLHLITYARDLLHLFWNPESFHY